jgi:fructose-bisphosphate aldolase class II
MGKLIDEVGTGVITGDKVLKVFEAARKHGFAIPSVNVTSSSSANAVLEAAKALNSPIILQISNGGAAFFAGKSIDNKNQYAAIAGATAGAQFIRSIAPSYGVPVILHSDHCAKNLLPWFDGMMAADKQFFEKNGEPLFSSHMLDLSEETDPENIATCVKYFTEMKALNIWLEMEIGITGGEEDGVDNTNMDQSRLYTQPEQVLAVHNALAAIDPKFSIAAAFGNVHGVYKPGNVKLSPEMLVKHQEFVKEKLGSPLDKPLFLVMHGGSGSTKEEIATAVAGGVVKMNVDTDTQWSYWEGLKNFYEAKKGYLQAQIGNPDGADKPNKKFYDPRVWIREAEKTMVARVKQACTDLGNVNTLDLEI